MSKPKQPKGFVIYRGPSLLDGAPIVAIAMVNSENRKTGNMVQTYILRDDGKPTDNVKSGADASICGDCKHRPSNGGACYVTVFQGPLVVWKQLQMGAYPDADSLDVGQMVAGRMVRLGTYGDPAAVPVNVWESLTRYASGRTGYTHQWRNLPKDQDALMMLVMASCDTADEAAQARAMGYRYFRIRTADESIGEREFVCPASDEAGKRKTCAECGACDGSERGAKASAVIIAHGPTKTRFAKQRVIMLAQG